MKVKKRNEDSNEPVKEWIKINKPGQVDEVGGSKEKSISLLTGIRKKQEVVKELMRPIEDYH